MVLFCNLFFVVYWVIIKKLKKIDLYDFDIICEFWEKRKIKKWILSEFYIGWSVWFFVGICGEYI